MPLVGRIGMNIRTENGCEELGCPDRFSTPLFYCANSGDTLKLSNPAYEFKVATYRPKVESRWIYTYAYAPDQIWAIYNHDLDDEHYRQDDFVFDRSVFFRVCLRKINNEHFNAGDNINDILAFESSAPDLSEPANSYIHKEAQRTARRAADVRNPGDLAFLIMTDTHYNVNGTWSDTKDAVALISSMMKLDGIIHLGDLTDGMVTRAATRHYAKVLIHDLKRCGVPVWLTLGNHDTNYFMGNPERFSVQELQDLYLDGREIRYHVDFPYLRLIFLDSFDPDDKVRYGYTPACIHFLEHTLSEMPDNKCALIFSHLPPLARLQYWVNGFRGELEIAEVLRRYTGKILGWINGHNHADRLDNDEGFPIISIGNAKCEAFTERKPEGFVTPMRRLGDTSQELFDILLVNGQQETAHFVRFGAGRERIIFRRKADWI